MISIIKHIYYKHVEKRFYMQKRSNFILIFIIMDIKEIKNYTRFI